jgi:hypothetical protein
MKASRKEKATVLQYDTSGDDAPYRNVGFCPYLTLEILVNPPMPCLYCDANADHDR